MSTCTSWTTQLSALLTPTIAIAVGIISYRQWRTAQNKLKLDLFEKRIAIFDEAMAFIFESHGPEGASEEVMSRFITTSSRASWILNDDIAQILRSELYEKAIQIKVIAADLRAAEPPNKSAKTAELFKAQAEIREFSTELIKKFSPFLKLSH